MDKDALWYKLTLSTVQIEANEPLRISGEVADASVRNGIPSNLALFKKKNEENPAVSVTFYLPPSAREYCPNLLRQYAWQQCSNPGPDEADVEYGSSWHLDLLVE